MQRIEWGEMLPRLWQVKLEQALTKDAIARGIEKIVLITGCSDTDARQWSNNLPTILPISFYQYQAQYLVRELRKVQVVASVIAVG